MQTDFVQTLAEIRVKAKDYPHYTLGLKEAGVQLYQVEVASHQITYFDINGTKLYAEEGKPVEQTLKPRSFDQAAIQKAIKANQEGRTDYQNFLQEIWEAGVSHYKANLGNNQISYQGDSGKAYVEDIPIVTWD